MLIIASDHTQGDPQLDAHGRLLSTVMEQGGDLFDPQPRIIDLFAGPGGLDVGAAWLGIPTTGIELDDNACATREAAGLHTVQGDVTNHGPADFPEATVLTGGPPCQTFTVAGSGTGRRSLDEIKALVARMADGDDAEDSLTVFEDVRTGLVLEPMRWALEALQADAPFEAIVLEQVPQVLPIWTAFREVLEHFGYGVDHGIVRTEEFGVPQTRRRAVLIARLDDENVALPEPTHQAFRRGMPDDPTLTREPWVSMADALDRKSAFTVISNYGSGGDPRNRGRRRSDEPSATVTGKIMRNRLHLANDDFSRFTHQEAGRLQTFPADYPWSGSDIGQQIGNAIPPRLAVHIIAAALGKGVNMQALDTAVRSSWDVTKTGAISMSPLDARDESMALLDL